VVKTKTKQNYEKEHLADYHSDSDNDSHGNRNYDRNDLYYVEVSIEFHLPDITPGIVEPRFHPSGVYRHSFRDV